MYNKIRYDLEIDTSAFMNKNTTYLITRSYKKPIGH